MRAGLFIATITLTALTACDSYHEKPKPTPDPTYQTAPAPEPYPTPEPEPYPTPTPEPYPTPAPEPYPTPAPEPYPTPAPEPYPTPAPEPYPTPAPEPYPTPAPEPYPVPEPYPTPEPEPYPTSAPAPYSTPLPDPYGGNAPGPIIDAGISLEEGPCFGTCPIYTMTIYPNEFYELDAGRFTINQGMSTGTLPAGSWAAARAALTTANFNSLPTDVSPGNPAACGTTVATDLPTARVSETTIVGTRTVTYYPGCFNAPDKAALDQLLAGLRSAMQVTGLVVAP